MDFYYRNNLAKNDFISSLQSYTEGGDQWEIQRFGYPCFTFDIKSTSLYIKFVDLEPKKDYFVQNLVNYTLSIDQPSSSLLMESTADNVDYAITFYSEESLREFHQSYLKLLKQRILKRKRSDCQFVESAISKFN